MEKGETSVRIGLLTYPGVALSAIYGLADIIETADRVGREAGVRRRLKAVQLSLDSDGLPLSQRLDALILPPSAVNGAPDGDDVLLEWIRNQHRGGAVVCSVCAGAFLLARTGLLNGRQATTHWALKEQLAEAFPQTKIEADRLLIDDGDIITAAGMLSWVDLGLWLVDRFLSPSIMLEVARLFLADPRGREQRFYSSFAPRLNHGDAGILKVQHWLQTVFARRIGIIAMADQAGLSKRTFQRRFQKATGLNPTAYLQLLRIGKARELLEQTAQPVNWIAGQVGYEDPAAFGKMFRRVIGLTQAEYRRRFGIAGNPRTPARSARPLLVASTL